MNAFYEFTPQTYLLVTDEDAGDFLQSQFTNELRPFVAGTSTYGLWLNVKGKVLGDSVVLCEGDEAFRLISETSEASAIVEHMERHIIADEVEIEATNPGFGFCVEGDALTSLGLALPDSGKFIQARDYIIYPARYLPAPSYNIVFSAAGVAQSFRAQLLEAGFVELSEEEKGLRRIECTAPLIPTEIGSGDMPGEGGLETDAISFTKGCYLGQEVVARLHNIGKPQRSLFVVSSGGSAPECPLALFNEDSKQVGELRSAYRSENGWIGVAILKTRFAQPGDRLRSETVEIIVLKTL